jgi:hypothetical protein
VDHLEHGGASALVGLDLAVEPLVVTTTGGACIGIYLPVEGPAYLRVE